jgi:hypothetical protein
LEFFGFQLPATLALDHTGFRIAPFCEAVTAKQAGKKADKKPYRLHVLGPLLLRLAALTNDLPDRVQMDGFVICFLDAHVDVIFCWRVIIMNVSVDVDRFPQPFIPDRHVGYHKAEVSEPSEQLEALNERRAPEPVVMVSEDQALGAGERRKQLQARARPSNIAQMVNQISLFDA